MIIAACEPYPSASYFRDGEVKRRGYGKRSRSGASGMAASPTMNAVKCPTSVNVGLTAALTLNAATAETWLRDRQGGRT